MTTRVYKLEIIYPEGSREPGWRPSVWSDPEFLAKLTAKQRRELKRAGFRWPRERLFLSSSGAYGRANLLRWYGAEVDVIASAPVAWPNYDDESGHWETSTTASTWRPMPDWFIDKQDDRETERFRQALEEAGFR